MTSDLKHPPIAGAHHMALSVRNLDRSIRFYCDVLGAALIHEPYDGDSPSFSGRMAIVALGALGLDLIEHSANGGELFGPVRTGLDHLSFPADSMADLGQWADWLDTSNIENSGVRDVAGIGGMLNFADPDGISLEIIYVDLEKLSQGAHAADV